MTALAFALAAVLTGLYALLFAGAVLVHLGVLVGAAVAIYIVDAALSRIAPEQFVRMLSAVGAAPNWRAFIRQSLFVLYLVRADHPSQSTVGIVVAGILVHHIVLGLDTGLRTSVRRMRLRQLETFNLPVPSAELPPELTERLNVASSVAARADVLFLVALAVSGRAHYGLVIAAVLAMVLVALVPCVPLAAHVLALRRLTDDEHRLAIAQQAVLDLAPLVVLYFSGGNDSVYQVNMWLETMARLDRPVLVLLRERRYLDRFGPTSVPALCLPFTADVMNFQMPSVRVALYVANVGRNLHLLREPGMKSAFIGHGDSDKTASFNPATKVYDEVWVAGDAGRERYLRAQVGVRDDEIVLVGRPQLDAIHEASGPPGDPFTVLYAPTWEGWTDDRYATSLVTFGRAIVSTLLATDGVRVVYKPHPLTGTVDPETAAADKDIAAMITAAGAPHACVLDNSRALYDLFDESDALVSDISSVVSDYLRSGKPYFVTNTAGMDEETFRDVNPSAGAAYLIRPACGLTDGLTAARGADQMREHRRTVRAHLLGDPSLDPMTLFRQAVDDLADRADEQRSALIAAGGDAADALAPPAELDEDAASGPAAQAMPR
ncbi:MAG: CDP-glycerol glycerophosphotransferase family protein [Jatrophihabitans sp.]